MLATFYRVFHFGNGVLFRPERERDCIDYLVWRRVNICPWFHVLFSSFVFNFQIDLEQACFSDISIAKFSRKETL